MWLPMPPQHPGSAEAMDGLDVDGRLAEAEPIVEDLMIYVAACEAL